MYSFLNPVTICQRNTNTLTLTTLQVWEREEISFKLIPPWNTVSFLSECKLQQILCCVSFGLVSIILLFHDSYLHLKRYAWRKADIFATTQVFNNNCRRFYPWVPEYKLLRNRTRNAGLYCKLYCKLRTVFFPLHELKRKKQGTVTYSTDRENEVSKMFITSLGN